MRTGRYRCVHCFIAKDWSSGGSGQAVTTDLGEEGKRGGREGGGQGRKEGGQRGKEERKEEREEGREDGGGTCLPWLVVFPPFPPLPLGQVLAEPSSSPRLPALRRQSQSPRALARVSPSSWHFPLLLLWVPDHVTQYNLWRRARPWQPWGPQAVSSGGLGPCLL